MKSSIKTGSAALVFAVALLSGAPAIAQQGVDSASVGNTGMDNRGNDGMDWGWLGLLGLAGLVGMRRKHDDISRVHSSTATR